MVTIREATFEDVKGIREVFRLEYGEKYAYPEYYDELALTRLIYTNGSVILVAIDDESGIVVGTASVVFSIGAYNDLVGEFGRLVVHPEFRGRGIGKQLMEARLELVRPQLHVGLVDNRTAHIRSQQISARFGFVPVGLIPMKLLVERRESIAVYAQHFGDALTLRRNNPRVIPEAHTLANIALHNCGLPKDAIVDDSSSPMPYDDDFELDELKTEGYAALLRIERGRVANRTIFGPMRLHYGLFQLRARDSHYLIAKRDGHIAGGLGFTIDFVEKAVRVFELISLQDEPTRFLFKSLLDKCRAEYGVEFVEVDVNAYCPATQRTLLELGFLPVCYVPAAVFHQVERLDSLKMAKVLVPLDLSDLEFCDAVLPIANLITEAFLNREVAPRIATAARQTPLFAGLNEEQRRQLLSIAITHRFKSGEHVYRQGHTDGAMHLLIGGKVALLGNDGQALAVIGAGQCAGETSLLYSAQISLGHSVDAVAHSEVETAAFPKLAMEALIRRRPDIGVLLYRNLAAEISSRLKQTSDCG